MHSIRRTLTLAALALAGTLAACSDNTTVPRANDDPLVQQLNRLANGQGRVLSVERGVRSVGGLPAGMTQPAAGLQSLCTQDGGCEHEPRDPTCYSNCWWFDVDARSFSGTNSSPYYKWVQLEGWFYGHGGGVFPGYEDVYFYSAGGCTSTPSLYLSSHEDMAYAGEDLLAWSNIQYTGVFNWAVFVDGWGTNIYGRDGNETDYDSLCW